MTTSIILDIETLSRRQNAVITEIGAIAVNRIDFTAFDELLLFPGFFRQIELGRHLCNETIQFHRKNKTLPRQVGDEPIEETYRKLSEFITRHNPYRIWIQGKDFDLPKLDTLFEHIGKELPWKYYTPICSRDTWDLAFHPDFKRDKRPHDAIGDCKATLRDTHKALSHLHRLERF